MESLLNILWVLLALPAMWLWRSRAASRPAARYWDRLRAPVLLLCAMVLLFPVISVSDDLHIAQAEMEECKPSRRVKQLVAPSVSGPMNHAGGFAALPVCSLWL